MNKDMTVLAEKLITKKGNEKNENIEHFVI
jgi:hypothetical protein